MSESKGNPNPSPLTRFKPGQSGNPAGTHTWPPEYKAVRKLTKMEVAEVGSLVLKNDFKALEALALAPDATVLQKMIATVAKKVILTGDMDTLNRLLDRLIGPVRQEVSHHVMVGQAMVEKVASVLEDRLKGQPDLLLLIADDLAGLLSDTDGDGSPVIEVKAETDAKP